MAQHEQLYKKDSSGKTRVWYVERVSNRYRTVAGVESGSLVTSEWTTTYGRNRGKRNETTDASQAVLEVEAMYAKKRKEGYSAEGEETRQFIEPMLAKEYGKFAHKVVYKDGVWAQPKLDGIRCLLSGDGMFTRRGEPIVSCPHIAERLQRFADRHDIVFDGELYNHGLREDFNEIASLVRKQNCTDIHHIKTAGLVEYHIYDVAIEDEVFQERHARLRAIAGDLKFSRGEFSRIVLVPTFWVTSQTKLDECYGEFLQEGFEGQMVRLNAVYEPRRTHNLLKRKEFLEEEFEVVSVDEGVGNRSGMAGRVTLRLPSGKTFGAGIRGGVALNKMLLLFADKQVGKMATVRFQNYTPDGVPRFPVVKDIGRND